MKVGELLKILAGMNPEGEVVIRANYEYGFGECVETIGKVSEAEVVTGQDNEVSVDTDIYDGHFETDEEGIDFITLPEGVHLFVELKAIKEC